MITEALQYAEKGWPVFPCEHRGKRPATTNGLHDATTDSGQIDKWFGNGQLFNIGIRTGAESGVDVLDIDGAEGQKSLQHLIEVYGDVPDTPCVRTGGGGLHYYFKHADGVRNSASTIGPKIDVRGDGGYVVAPGSFHESGNEYKWITPTSTPLADWPSWLLSRMNKPEPTQPQRTEPTTATIADGQRNDTLTRLAGSMRAKGFDAGAIEAALAEHNRVRCSPALPDSEVAKIAKSVGRYEPHPESKPGSLLHFERTDFGAGEAFASVADDFLFDGNAGQWLQWDGKRWRRDSSKQARKAFVQRVARVIREQAVSLQADERAAWERYALVLETSHKITNALAEAQVHKTRTDFDADNFLLNVQNGTINLNTGQLQPHNKADYITKICPVVYNPEARSERFDRFLNDVTGGDADYLRFLQKVVGYSLTGDTREEKLFFVHGPKQSGKSTLIEAIKRGMGDYAHVADFETFLKKPAGGIRNDIAALHGARFVCSIEVDDGKALAEGIVKTLTGGDTIRARYLYKESFEFLPQFKLWLVANHRPRVSDQDDAMWRRILVLPFAHSVPPEQCDATLKPYLRDPQGGGASVLAWAVQGAMRWQAEGLGDVPDAVERATGEYRETMDPVREFFEDRLEFIELAKCTVSEMRSAYESWCNDIGQKYTLSPRDFNERLEARGVERKTIYLHGRNQKCWSGVGVLYLEQP